MSLLSMQKSWTADGIAVARALHYLYESPVVLEDAVAIDLLSPVARLLCQSEVIYRLFIKPAFAPMMPLILHSFSCQRYTEDQITLERGRQMKPYVILGAGLDSFALRHQKQGAALRVFEVDQPESQEIKQQRIARSPHATPANLEFVPVNFEVETVLDGLAHSSFDFEKPAFCSWLGTVQYLTEHAVYATLDSIASLTPGSELVLNYLAPDESLSAPDREFMRSIEWKLRLGSAPVQCEFAPDTIAKKVSELGFDILAHLTAKELDDRYLRGWEGLQTMPSGRLLHLQVAGRTPRRPRKRRRSPSRATRGAAS
jgi:methyltransferase (TIGR00027 family)